jgi:hypothetical protein
MEIAITLPNDVIQRAEELAAKLGISLTELYSQALSRFLESHDEDDEITRNLNEVYSRIDSSLDPFVMQMQLTALDEEDW